MLTGPPGTGKTSTITALASQYQLPIYLLPIGSSDMTDDALARAFQTIPSRSIVVLEDVDVAMAKSRQLPSEVNDESKPSTEGASPSRAPAHKAGISLSALLNGIDGVGAGEGRILVSLGPRPRQNPVFRMLISPRTIKIMTTNDISGLDPALIRPGRVDLTFRYQKATSAQANQLFCLFYENRGAMDTVIPPQDRQQGSASLTDEPIGDISKLADEWCRTIEDGQYSMAALQGEQLSCNVRLPLVREAPTDVTYLPQACCFSIKTIRTQQSLAWLHGRRRMVQHRSELRSWRD